MTKNTSILLGDYFDDFINQQVKSGKFSSASEVVRAALRLFEHEETKKTELKKGENSGFVKDFSRDSFLNSLHQKIKTTSTEDYLRFEDRFHKN